MRSLTIGPAALAVLDPFINGGDGVDRTIVDCALDETATQVERTTCG
jgi:hypothetical protein